VPADQVADVLYPDLMRDPIGVVRAIYERFDTELTPDAEARMREFLARNPKNKSGQHRYTLEEFGLDAGRETVRFADYARRFGL
jgi:hypothetical protein